jgi:hypothetical protein
MPYKYYYQKILADINNCDLDHIGDYEREEAKRELCKILGIPYEFELVELLKVLILFDQ